MSNKLLDKVRERGTMNATISAAQTLKVSGDENIAGVAKDAKNLLLTQIEPDPDQPRIDFNSAALNILVKDIQARGVLQPILVSPPNEPGGLYRIISGERRWRASQLAGKTRIPCLVREMDETDRRIAQLVENIIREDLSDIEKGKALRNLYELRKRENAKITWDEVADEVGLKRTRIHELFHLSQLPVEITDLIQSGHLSGSHGIQLYRVMDKLGEEAVVGLARDAARKEDGRPGSYGMSVSVLRGEIARRLSPPETEVADTESKPEPTSVPGDGEDLVYLEQTLEALRSGTIPESYREQLRKMLNEGLAK